MKVLPVYIASRFSRRTPGGSARSGLTVGIIGVALALMVMIVSVGVMNGFKQEVRRKVIGFESALTLAPGQAAQGTTLRDHLFDSSYVSLIRPLLPDDVDVEMTIRQPAILKTPSNFGGALIKGIAPDTYPDFIAEHLVAGEIPDYSADSTLYHIVVSSTLAATIDACLDDKIDAFFIGDGAYRVRRLKIKGIFDTHFDEFDKNFVISSIDMLRAVSDLPEGTSTLLEINGFASDEAIDSADIALRQFATDRFARRQTDNLTGVINIHQSGALYFNWLSLLDTNVTVILVLMGLLSALTIVSSLFILVLRRVSEIGILKALGASDALIRRVFITLTLRVVIIGMIIGNLLGVGFLVLQQSYSLIPLNPEAYYLDAVPAAISPMAIVILNAAVLLAATLILQLPSAIVSTISPARTITYQ